MKYTEKLTCRSNDHWCAGTDSWLASERSQVRFTGPVSTFLSPPFLWMNMVNILEKKMSEVSNFIKKHRFLRKLQKSLLAQTVMEKLVLKHQSEPYINFTVKDEWAPCVLGFLSPLIHLSHHSCFEGITLVAGWLQNSVPTVAYCF